MSKKKCNTIELKKPVNFGILSSLDGDSMAERNYSREWELQKNKIKKVSTNLSVDEYEAFTKATEKNCTTKNAVLKQFIIDYIEKNKS